MSFFQICNENPPAVLPIFGLKTINYTKTTLDYSPKKSIGCRFFPFSQFKDPFILKMDS